MDFGTAFALVCMGLALALSAAHVYCVDASLADARRDREANYLLSESGPDSSALRTARVVGKAPRELGQ